jgi:two-component system invasion response regulator UvrY
MAGTSRTNAAASLIHIEDDSLTASLVGQLLGCWKEIRYLGSVTNGQDGIRLCRDQQPGIVLLDLALPDMDGFAVAGQLRKLRPSPRILVFSARVDDVTILHLSSGLVDGIVWKPLGPEKLRPALAEIAAGRDYFPPDFRAAIDRLRRSPDAFFKILSDRELSLMPHFARDESDAVIATAVGVSAATVHSHRQHVFAKLNLHCAHDLAQWAQHEGFR